MANVMYGPMQMVVIGFDEPEFHGQVLKQLRSLREKGTMRLIDLLFVWKDADGKVTEFQATDLTEEERMRFGAVVGALIGFGAAGKEGARAGAEAGAERVAEYDFGIAADDLATIADAIPADSAAAVMLIEHTWAIGLKQALRDAGGFVLAQGMVTPEALLLAGADLAAAVEAADKEEKEKKRVAVPAQ
ncbi:DUF1269 domain-containing protein [Methanofollis sp. UBA420]|uniref:DUF1269 domain-containing protein n=1 Tax=Methanofollis sp. UBA420 TaxID=1915514 RepID=UPI00316AC940